MLALSDRAGPRATLAAVRLMDLSTYGFWATEWLTSSVDSVFFSRRQLTLRFPSQLRGITGGNCAI